MFNKYSYNPLSGSSAAALANIQCTNCTNTGHTSRNCPRPITSYGVILFRTTAPWKQSAYFQQSHQTITGFESIEKNIEYLLIQRKDSIGYIELIRGKYQQGDYSYIKHHLAGTTAAERRRLLECTYDDLWEGLWGPPKDGHPSYRHEKEQGQFKLELLRNGSPSLKAMIDESPPPFDTPEWGFPKGRKNTSENEYTCAMREMWEETNIKETDLILIRNMDPITESFVGSNGVSYCHKYFIAYAPPGIEEINLEKAAETNEHIKQEVGDLKWLPIDKAVEKIRPTNSEKRDVLLRINGLLKKYCPLHIGGRMR
jgi:8-oxo-dGTP pyrophosphatase MutT (NUDIX family)